MELFGSIKMIRMRLYVFSYILSALIVLSGIGIAQAAQDTIVGMYINSDSIQMGESTCLDITVENFYEITSGQASVNFDPFQLRFDSVTNLNPEIGFTPENLGLVQLEQGIFRFNFFRVPGNFNLDDGEVLISMCFTAIGEPEEFAPVNLTDFPIEVEFTRNFQLTGHQVRSGGIETLPPDPFQFVVRSCASDSLIVNGQLSWISYGSTSIYPVGISYRHLDVSGISGLAFLNSSGDMFLLDSVPPGNLEFTLEGPSVDLTDTILIRDYGNPFVIFDVRNPSCHGDSDGSILLADAPEDRFFVSRWSTNLLFESSINDLSEGVYYHVFTDEGACMIVDTFNIATLPLSVIDEVMDNSCPGDSLGSILVTAEGGTPFNGDFYQFTWETGNSQTTLNALREKLVAGSYAVTVTDSNGCSDSLEFEIINAFEITADIVIEEEVVCSGDSNAMVSIELGYLGSDLSNGFVVTPLFSEGFLDRENNLLIFSDLPAGSYEILVTDSLNGRCENTISFTLTEADTIPYLSSISISDEACPGAANGSVTLHIRGGDPFQDGSYEVTWSHGVSGEETDELTVGDYQFTVTDARGCSFSDSVSIEVGVAPEIVSQEVTHLLCFGDSDGAISLQIVEGSNGPVVVEWNHGAEGELIEGLEAGDYLAVISDSAGCVINLEITVNQPDSIAVIADIINESAEGESDGSISLSISGGVEPYDVLWDDQIGIEGPIVEALSAGTYCATITDGNGCIVEDLCFVVELPSGALTITESDDFVLYPNPFHENVLLENRTASEVRIRVVSVDGKLMFESIQRGNGYVNIQGGDWASGTYIMLINKENRTYSEKLIKH